MPQTLGPLSTKGKGAARGGGKGEEKEEGGPLEEGGGEGAGGRGEEEGNGARGDKEGIGKGRGLWPAWEGKGRAIGPQGRGVRSPPLPQTTQRPMVGLTPSPRRSSPLSTKRKGAGRESEGKEEGLRPGAGRERGAEGGPTVLWGRG